MIEYIFSMLLLTADFAQTRYVADHPRLVETNLILGAHPTKNAVNVYFAGIAALNTSALLLPPKTQKSVFRHVTYFETYIVLNNASIGARFRF